MKKRDAEPVEEPVAEQQPYPKMLYVGPYRQQVTVCTAEEEAQWAKAHDEQMAGAEAALGASASVSGVQTLGAPVDDDATLVDDDSDDAGGSKRDKKGKR